MKWGDKIERLRQWVTWECKDIPPDLVLSIIQRESGGKIGAIGRGKTRCGELTDSTGNKTEICHALGLMQTIPATVAWYNKTVTGNDIATLDDMIGSDERAARMQIRIGCKYLAYINHFLHEKFPDVLPAASLSSATDDQISLVLTAYLIGHGSTAKKINALIDAGKKISFLSVKNAFPEWGKVGDIWVNRPIKYAESVMSQFSKHRSGSYDSAPGAELVKRTIGQVSHGGGAALAILFVAGAAWLINRHYTRPRGINENT
jgi:hypothetical protein